MPFSFFEIENWPTFDVFVVIHYKNSQHQKLFKLSCFNFRFLGSSGKVPPIKLEMDLNKQICKFKLKIVQMYEGRNAKALGTPSFQLEGFFSLWADHELKVTSDYCEL